MNRITFYIGLVLIAISFIGCVLSYYLLVFGIPTFIIGAILVLISKQPIQTKLLTTLIPIVLYFPFTEFKDSLRLKRNLKNRKGNFNGK